MRLTPSEAYHPDFFLTQIRIRHANHLHHPVTRVDHLEKYKIQQYRIVEMVSYELEMKKIYPKHLPGWKISAVD